jgi:two-component system, NarL family, sensor histidine kinase UhpB
MARSPDYLRLATSATRTLAEAAFDNLREAVLVVDVRAKHLPVVLANRLARERLTPADSSLLDSSLYGYLEAESASLIEPTVSSLTDATPAVIKALSWRPVGDGTAFSTEFKLLDSSQNQRLVMLTFDPQAPALEVGSAVEQLPVCVLILDKNLRVIYANPAAARASEANGSVLGLSALDLRPTNVLSREVYQRALDGQTHHEGVQAPCRDGTHQYLLMLVQPFGGVVGAKGVIVLFGDLSAGALRAARTEGERHLKSLIEDSMDILTIAAADGRLLYASRGAHAVFGYPADPDNAPIIFDFLHPEDAAVLREKFRELKSGAIHAFSQQQRVQRWDGSCRWLESHYVAAFNNPLINGVTISSHNIDERKYAESQLAQRQEIFRLAAEAVDGIIFEWDLARGVVHRSRGVREILGIEPEDMAPVVDAWRERIHPRDVDAANRQIGLALIQGRGWATSYRIRDARGRYRSMLERGLIQRSAEGDPVRAIGCCVDVSEIKRLTDLLAEAQRTAQMGGWEYSYTTLDLAWTEEMYRIYETTPAEFIPSWDAALAQYTPESRQRFHDAWREAETGDGVFDMEAEITTFRGRRIWVRVIAHFEMLDGRPVRSYGSVQNIDEQKLAQLTLETSTGWLKLSMQMAHMHPWRWDKVSDTFEFAIVDHQRTHLPTAFPSMTEVMSRLHPRDRMPVSRAIEESFRTRTELQTEFRLRNRRESYRSYATIARPVFDTAGRPLGFVGVTQDVTARRESEAKLRRSEQLLRVTTANTADTLLLVDTELKVRFVNRGDGNLRVDEIVGREIAEILPEAARGVVVAKLRHVLNTGEMAVYTYESCEAGREPQYFESRAVLVHDDGIGTALSISVTDITERKRLEQEILDVSSRERQSIGRDLHDGLGQELTGIALMLRGLATRFQNECVGGVAGINEVVGLVNQSIETARSLARGLLPVRTESGGLPFALRELAARSRDLYGLTVNFRSEIWPEITLSETSSSHLYRIAQEALTNAARHGRAARVDILLMANRNTFLLRITDDGIGIATPDKPSTGMGLKTMRYRAGMIGAKIEIIAGVPRGTVVRVSGEQPSRQSGLTSRLAINGGNDDGR